MLLIGRTSLTARVTHWSAECLLVPMDCNWVLFTMQIYTMFFLVDDYLRFSFVEPVPSTAVGAVIHKLDQLLPHLVLPGLYDQTKFLLPDDKSLVSLLVRLF